MRADERQAQDLQNRHQCGGQAIQDDLALNKFVNAVHGLELHSLFVKLAAAGLMPGHSQPCARVLQFAELRLGAPRFMLHDLRKLVATVGEKFWLGDAVLRRILNHTVPKTDVLHRHCVGLNDRDTAKALV